MNRTFGILTAALLIIVLATAGVSAQLTDSTDTDGDGIPDRVDTYPYDRDNDGIPDATDRYPDDPENRDTEETLDGPGAPGGDSTDPAATDEEVCCLFSVWWLWVIIGIILIAADILGINPTGRPGLLAVIGGALIAFGVYVGGFFGVV